MSTKATMAVAEAPGFDRRRQQRHVTLLRVGVLHIAGAGDICLVRNISPEGLMARVYRRASVGDKLQVELKSDHMIAGSVVWVRDWEIGVRFDTPIDVEAELSGRWVSEKGVRSRQPRVKADCPAKLRCGSRFYRARLCDISQGGAKVSLDKPLADDEAVALTLPDLPPLIGSARWVIGNDVGICFHERIPFEVLARWLQERSATGLPEEEA